MLDKPFNHGFAESDWDTAKKEARQAMIDCARLKSVLAYSDLVKRISRIPFRPNDRRLFRLLGEISYDEDEHGRGLLSALVVHKTGDMEPGPGFFDLAESRGRSVIDKHKCWVAEVNRLHAYWAKH